jgi:protein SCO1/2
MHRFSRGRRLVTAGLIIGTLLLGACNRSEPVVFHGVDVTDAAYGKDFRLLDPDGNERTLAL